MRYLVVGLFLLIVAAVLIRFVPDTIAIAIVIQFAGWALVIIGALVALFEFMVGGRRP